MSRASDAKNPAGVPLAHDLPNHPSSDPSSKSLIKYGVSSGEALLNLQGLAVQPDGRRCQLVAHQVDDGLYRIHIELAFPRNVRR